MITVVEGEDEVGPPSRRRRTGFQRADIEVAGDEAQQIVEEVGVQRIPERVRVGRYAMQVQHDDRIGLLRPGQQAPTETEMADRREEERRSEERRVGKECRYRWAPDHEKKKCVKV